MKSYTHTNGEPIANETLDQIADDVRKFDQELSTEARNTRALDRTAGHLGRIRDELTTLNDQMRRGAMERERVMFLREIQTAIALGIDPLVIMATPRVEGMLIRLGLTEAREEET